MSPIRRRERNILGCKKIEPPRIHTKPLQRNDALISILLRLFRLLLLILVDLDTFSLASRSNDRFFDRRFSMQSNRVTQLLSLFKSRVSRCGGEGERERLTRTVSVIVVGFGAFFFFGCTSQCGLEILAATFLTGIFLAGAFDPALDFPCALDPALSVPSSVSTASSSSSLSSTSSSSRST